MTSRTVIRMDKATTKARVVINASMIDSKTLGKLKSFNKLLMPGPNLLLQIMERIMKLMKNIFMIDGPCSHIAVTLEFTQDKDMLRYL